MLQAAARYYRTDIAVQATFSGPLKELQAYLNAGELQNHAAGTFHAGGGFAYNDTPSVSPDFIGPRYTPPGNPALHGVTAGPCPPTDDLDAVMVNEGERLREIEDALDRWGIGNPHLYRDWLVPASKANPAMIQTYAEEVLAAAKVYGELADGLLTDNNMLAKEWTGRAGHAAQEHGRVLHKYLTDCHDNAISLGQAATTSATILTKLRASYAAVARDHIQAINTAYQEIASWFGSWTGFFGHLTGDLKAAAGDLVDQLNEANALLVKAVNEGHQRAKDLDTVESGVASPANIPNLATNANAHSDPIFSASPTSDAWADPARWNE